MDAFNDEDVTLRIGANVILAWRKGFSSAGREETIKNMAQWVHENIILCKFAGQPVLSIDLEGSKLFRIYLEEFKKESERTNEREKRREPIKVLELHLKKKKPE